MGAKFRYPLIWEKHGVFDADRKMICTPDEVFDWIEKERNGTRSEAFAEITRLQGIASANAATITVPLSLAERTEAMFRSVDPQGAIAQEWKIALARGGRGE